MGKRASRPYNNRNGDVSVYECGQSISKQAAIQVLVSLSTMNYRVFAQHIGHRYFESFKTFVRLWMVASCIDLLYSCELTNLSNSLGHKVKSAIRQ